MKNFFKSNWLAIVICLVCALIAAGATFFFTNASVQESKVLALKMAEALKTAEASLVNVNTEMVATKEAFDKEKTLNADLKKMMAAVDVELESLRSSVNAMTLAAAKTAKPKEAKPKEAKPKEEKPQPRPVAVSSGCRESHPKPGKDKPGKDKLSVLQNLQADINRRDGELREKQKKLDEALNKLANEKRKVILQNSEYRWPHDNVPAPESK